MQNEHIHPKFTIDEITNLIETWLVSGELNPQILSEKFQFTSPFWKGANKIEFLAQFGDSKSYQETALSKITHFDPVIQLKSANGNNFSIILQYHTRNGHQVYETVFGTVADGLLMELRSIYDLDETKKALELNK
jgi:hypothetical protein